MWVAQLGSLLVVLGVLLAPGLLIGALLRLRGFALVAAAPPLSLAVVGLTTMVAVVVPFRWSLLPVVVTTVVVAAVAWAIARRFVPSPATSPAVHWSRRWAPWIAVALGAALLIPRLLTVFGDPESISQTFDNIYHLNAVRHMLDTGAAAPTEQLIPGFYPSLWHAVTSLVAGLAGTSVAAATNLTALLVAGLVWPLGCVYLVRQISGRQPAPLLVAGVLAAGMAGFPLLMLDFGVLYPNVLSIALLPSVLAALIAVARVGADLGGSRVVAWVLLLAWIPTLALAHPSTLMAFFAIGFWPAAAAGLRYFRGARDRPRVRVWAAGLLWVAGLAVVAAVLIVARPTSEQAFWGPFTSFGGAVVEVLTNSHKGLPVEWVPTLLMIVGIIVVLVAMRSKWWLVTGWATLGVIYVVGAAAPDSLLRYGLTGTWYSDMYRVMALFPVVVIPLAAVGFGALVTVISRYTRSRTEGARLRSELAVTGILVVGVIVATQLSTPMTRSTEAARWMHTISDDSPLLTLDELALLERVADHVPEDEVIVGSPWTGTSLAYAISDRRVLIPHIYQELDADMTTIVLGLNRAEDDPEVCAALERTDTRWVLDFGDREIHNAEHPFPGLEDLESAGVVELVDGEGDAARLYRITACQAPR
ncbi:DUF6541 family protein [Microbacterium sp. NPDC055357]